MRYSEVFLRLGCALVAWMVLYAHFVWLTALGVTGCSAEGEQLHRMLLALVPVAIGCAILLGATRPLDDVHRILRWLGLPLAALMLAGAYRVFAISRSVYATGLGICSSGEAAAWHVIWGPAQLLVIIVGALMIVRVWMQALLRRG